jgi:hypothetical protein
MEGADYGRCKAKVMRGDDGLFIHSFAHGRALYLLRHDVRSAKAAIAQAPVDGLIDHAMAILATTEMKADELADFVTTVAKASGIGVQAVKARIAKERRKREEAERKAAFATGGDGRLIRPRPAPDGELLPTTTFLDQVLASDQREEPPMRDASGNLIEVQVREPWALHLLTADGTNAAAEDAETMKAPAEPGLIRLTPTGVKMLIERYVRFRVEKKNTTYFRVLGVSLVETVPSTTVQIFTGNSITPRGDMASRSLMLALNVNRPDPENRAFAHPDPLLWTQANRPKIVRALYTLLIAGALNRPKQQEAKTRFKSWWNLVGWPMEYAAGLIGTTVNCTELMRAGEVGDEEASAASAALTIMREFWGSNAFTALDVVKAMTPEMHMENAGEARAEALAETLGELVGKRLDRPTARSIGKLFQKRLVGRPAWIDDGQAAATLRKSTGHNANKYRIHVSVPGQDLADTSSLNAVPARNIPHIPGIPRDRTTRATANRGMTGKTGKFSPKSR